MSTPFQSALLAFLEARDAEKASDYTTVGAAERALAQVGDVLESALRQMMREECQRGADEGTDSLWAKFNG